MRHKSISYQLTLQYGAFWTRGAGIVNELQGHILHDIPDLPGLLTGRRPWAYQIGDIIANEDGINEALDFCKESTSWASGSGLKKQDSEKK